MGPRSDLSQNKLVECDHIKSLEQFPAPPQYKINGAGCVLLLTRKNTLLTRPPGPFQCSECSLNKGLWLCLTCGHLGCSRCAV
jgi:uncharacterized UBP type Zn finger protein